MKRRADLHRPQWLLTESTAWLSLPIVILAVIVIRVGYCSSRVNYPESRWHGARRGEVRAWKIALLLAMVSFGFAPSASNIWTTTTMVFMGRPLLARLDQATVAGRRAASARIRAATPR